MNKNYILILSATCSNIDHGVKNMSQGGVY